MLPLIRLALDEDIGLGDVTTLACIPADLQASGRFLAREPLIVAGLDLLPEIYEQPVTLFHRDGRE